MKIVSRSLTIKEAEIFRRQIKGTPNITGYTTPELLRFGKVWVVEDNKRAVGFAALFDVGSWRDFAVFYVCPSHQGRGLGSRLFSEVISEAKKDERNLYITTRTPQTAHLIEKFGFKWATYRDIPPEIKRSNIQLFWSWYRIKESVRKLFKFRTLRPFKFAIFLSSNKR